MNQDEILKFLGTTNSPIAIGGHNSDSFDTDCQIYNLVVFDGKNLSDVITKHESKIIKTSHGNLSESNSETLLSYENLQIIHDEQWELKTLISKIQKKKNTLFSASAKNALVESQLAISKAKNALEQEDPFVACWIKSGIILLKSKLLKPKPLISNITNKIFGKIIII